MMPVGQMFFKQSAIFSENHPKLNSRKKPTPEISQPSSDLCKKNKLPAGFVVTTGELKKIASLKLINCFRAIK